MCNHNSIKRHSHLQTQLNIIPKKNEFREIEESLFIMVKQISSVVFLLRLELPIMPHPHLQKQLPT